MRLTTTQPSGEEIAFLDAARLHARRFDRALVTSIILLHSADELIIDPAGGVLAITYIKHAKRGVALLALLYTSALVALAWSILTSHWYVAALAAVYLLVLLATVALKFLRRAAALRDHGAGGTAWLITDVATEPGHGAGDRLAARAIDAASYEGASLVLSVARTNEAAIRLYSRHGFIATHADECRLHMRTASTSAFR